MGCFSAVADINSHKPRTPIREYKIHDTKFLFLFCLVIGIMLQILYDASVKGKPEIYLDGYDSWANVCGKKENEIVPGVPLSGLDRAEYKKQFFYSFAKFDISSVLAALRFGYGEVNQTDNIILCVKECPQKLTMCRELLTINGYDLSKLNDKVVTEKICEGLPFDHIIPHKDVFGYCIPDVTKLVR